MRLFSTFILIGFVLCISGCEENRKGFTSSDFSKMMNKSTSKTLEKAFKDPAAISSLNLKEQGLETLTEELDGRFVNLIQLILNDNNLTELPKSLGNLPKLRKLHVDKNKLRTLPITIGNLNGLELFFADQNEIETLPDVPLVFNKGAYVALRWNKIKELPSYFAESRFATLLLTGNPLEALPDNFGKLHYLNALNIANTNISSLPESFYELSSLKSLDVRGTKLSKETVDQVILKLPNCTVLSDY